MLFSVPQYIDVEDKVAGPLTAKQLGWMMLMFSILAVLWLTLKSKLLFGIVALPIISLFVGLAFVKPYGQTMISLVIAGVKFFILPKIYVWKRTVQHSSMPSVSAKQKDLSELMGPEDKKKKALENLKAIAKIVDSKGQDVEDNSPASILDLPRDGKRN